MTTTLRKAITALVLLVFLQVGDALKGDGLQQQRGVVTATNNLVADESRARVDLFAKTENTSKQGKGEPEEVTEEVTEEVPEKTVEKDLEMDDIPLDAVDDTAGKKGRGKAERGPIDISETPEDDATVSKGGGKGDDGSDAVETSVTASVTATTESPFENGIVLPGADDYAQLPEQVPGGLVQSTPSAPLTTTRELPMYAIRYIVKSDRAPNAGDYNELAIVTTEFLDRKFAACFQATPAKHAFTTIESYRIREPLVVEFHASSHFYIPGEVPLMSYMYEKLEQQFDAQSQAQDEYMNDLSGMSDTNPFSTAERIEIIDNRPPSGVANLRSGNSDEQKKRTLILVPVVVTVALFVLGLAFCLIFRRRNDDAKAGEGDDDNAFGDKGVETDNSSNEEGYIEEGTHTVEAPAMLNPNGTQYYGDDPETVRYLNSIRESGLEEASKSSCSEALEEVSLDDVSIEDDCSEESDDSDVLDGGEKSKEHMVDASSDTANENRTSMAGDDADESYKLENRAILSRDGEEANLEGKNSHVFEGNAPLLPHSEISEEETAIQDPSDDDTTGEAEQTKEDACSVVCENAELQDEEVRDVLLEEEKNSLTGKESASQGNREGGVEPASASNAAETTAALPPNDKSTESFSKNDQEEFNYLHLDSSFEEDLRSIA